MHCVGGDLCPNAICSRPSHTEKVYLDLAWLLCDVAVSMVTIFIQKEKLKICRAKFSPRQKHLWFLRGSLVGAGGSGCHTQGHRASKSSFPSPFLLHPTRRLSRLVFPPPHSSKWGTICSCCVLLGDLCVPAESVSSGKIAPCSAKEVDESQTRLIHLQIMQRVAVGRVSFFIFFFSQLKNKCQIPVEAV